MSTAPTAGRRRVLVVDDSDDLGASMAAALDLLGFDARTATDGPGALACMEGWLPDIIFLDLTMPGFGGLDVLRTARAEHWSRGMVMIAMTGWDAAAQRTRALDAGFDMFVEKPFDLEDLRALMTPYGACDAAD